MDEWQAPDLDLAGLYRIGGFLDSWDCIAATSRVKNLELVCLAGRCGLGQTALRLDLV